MNTFTKNLNEIKKIFAKLNISWVEPEWTTLGDINNGKKGKHAGLYWIDPERNLYFGLASKKNSIYERCKTHRAKLDVDLAKLYSTPRRKKSPRWIFPDGWKAGVRKFIIEDNGPIPDHFIKNTDGTVSPGCLNYPVVHKVRVEDIPVLIWNLNDLSAEQIKSIETVVIDTIHPYCNSETHKLRSMRKV